MRSGEAVCGAGAQGYQGGNEGARDGNTLRATPWWRERRPFEAVAAFQA